MKSIILISHGEMAAGVKASLEMIVGKQEHVYTVSLKPDGDNLQFKNELKDVIAPMNENVLIIADLLGGTPCNVATKNYLKNESVEIIAGMSLPLVMEAALNEKATPNELVQAAQSGVVNVKERMNKSEASKSVPTDDNLEKYQEFMGKANIVNTRIDERLIHGQVAGIWAPTLNTQRIIVVNDQAANDDLQRSSLRMAAPAAMRLSVLTVKEAAKNIAAGKYGKQRIFLVFKNPTELLRYLELGGSLKTVNVGNMSHKEGAREVTKSIKVLPEEEIAFKKISQKGITITAQLVPNDPAIDFMTKLNN